MQIFVYNCCLLFCFITIVKIKKQKKMRAILRKFQNYREEINLLMKTIISIDGNFFTDDDICVLNTELSNLKIEFNSIISQGFIGTEIILILIELAKNIGYMTTYDILKYSLFKIFNLVASKENSKKQKKFEIICNGKSYTIYYDFLLNEEQKNKLIETAIIKILND